ncbi:MAG TPA: hypothetical protein VKF42_12225 [Chitinivibrionales bacterium]|nr:hypothetical protein [Chitinivibrionales bacterium]
MTLDMNSAVIVPLFSNAHFTQIVVLDDTQYQLAFHWNGRGGFWSMDISDGLGNLLIAGIRLVIWYPLTLQYNIAGLPGGSFMLIDNSIETWTKEAGRNDFTDARQLELVYMSKAA